MPLYLQRDLQKFSLKITTCWAIINRKLASNSVHNYPNSILSGVYYLKTPENCGGIFFCDPRPASQMIVPPSIEFNLWNFPKITYCFYHCCYCTSESCKVLQTYYIDKYLLSKSRNLRNK
ncbi:MAG: putative 2OG-Fe(II) oxygenase [Dolichospermum sp.]